MCQPKHVSQTLAYFAETNPERRRELGQQQVEIPGKCLGCGAPFVCRGTFIESLSSSKPLPLPEGFIMCEGQIYCATCAECFKRRTS